METGKYLVLISIKTNQILSSFHSLWHSDWMPTCCRNNDSVVDFSSDSWLFHIEGAREKSL